MLPTQCGEDHFFLEPLPALEPLLLAEVTPLPCPATKHSRGDKSCPSSPGPGEGRETPFLFAVATWPG